MFISRNLKQSNVAEYLLYMWQVEDLLRANELDLERVKDTVVSRYELSEEQRAELLQWYADLIDMMRREGVVKGGHLQINKNVLLDLNDMRAVLKRGAYVEFDNFGKEFTSGSAYGRFPSDAERLEVLYRLVDDGFLPRLLASCDVCLKNLLTVHGGPGYAHVAGKMAARIRAERNDADALLAARLVDNPAEYLDNPRVN